MYSRELGEVLVRLLDVGGGALHHKVVKRPPVVGNLHTATIAKVIRVVIACVKLCQKLTLV